MATSSACGSQLKGIGEWRAMEESSEGNGVGGPASAGEQATAWRTEYATAVEEQIAHSKRHWSCLATPSPSMLAAAATSAPSSSCLPDDDDDDDVAIELDNKAVFKDLLDHPTWGHFFHIFGDDTDYKWKSSGTLEVGEKFAEGAQAELFHARVTWRRPEMNEWYEEGGVQWVLKVFKKGTMLRHLQSQWPEGYFQAWVKLLERSRLGLPLEDRWRCQVMYGTLIEDGRFAFMMTKEDEDLRRLIDRNMVKLGHHWCGPFSKEEEEDIMYRIARGMDWLHNNNIVHRDLKASNVLVDHLPNGVRTCNVADFECSIGVVGTGFFKAPEILQACKERNVNEKQELFSRAADVYSYGMTCYEVLTGKLPFEHHPLNDNMSLLVDLVMKGLRPEVPDFVDGWKVELLQSCWQSNVEERPTFEEILELFQCNLKSEYILEEEIDRRKE